MIESSIIGIEPSRRSLFQTPMSLTIPAASSTPAASSEEINDINRQEGLSAREEQIMLPRQLNHLASSSGEQNITLSPRKIVNIHLSHIDDFSSISDKRDTSI